MRSFPVFQLNTLLLSYQTCVTSFSTSPITQKSLSFHHAKHSTTLALFVTLFFPYLHFLLLVPFRLYSGFSSTFYLFFPYKFDFISKCVWVITFKKFFVRVLKCFLSLIPSSSLVY